MGNFWYLSPKICNKLSGSMSDGEKIGTLKIATKTLIDNLRDKFDNKSNYRVAIFKNTL